MMTEVPVTPKFPLASSFSSAREAQRQWFESRAEFLMGGGSCGSVKTSTAIIDGSVEYDDSNMHTIMFRKALKSHSEAIRILREWFSQCGATLKENAPLTDSAGRANSNSTSRILRWPWELEQPHLHKLFEDLIVSLRFSAKFCSYNAALVSVDIAIGLYRHI